MTKNTILTEQLKKLKLNYEKKLLSVINLKEKGFVNPESDCEEDLIYSFNNYKGTDDQKLKKLLNSLEKEYKKSIEKYTNKYNEIMSSEPEDSVYIIVEWKNHNCQAFDNSRNESYKANGHGYDKLSLAVANLLNTHHKWILKKLYTLKNKHLSLNNHELFGYGSGYGLFPYLEGGVGVECYPEIFEKIGYVFKHVLITDNSDVFIIEKCKSSMKKKN